MNVANLDLSRELDELSGWADTEMVWRYNMGLAIGTVVKPKRGGRYELSSRILSTGTDVFSAYDLGYLMRRLPTNIKGNYNQIYELVMWKQSEDLYNYNYVVKGGWDLQFDAFTADIPEDAAAKLAIKLFKQGSLTKEQS